MCLRIELMGTSVAGFKKRKIEEVEENRARHKKSEGF